MKLHILIYRGSTVTGKCGFGPEAVSEECYCSIPTRVFVGPENKRIRRLSCGGSHTGVITEGASSVMPLLCCELSLISCVLMFQAAICTCLDVVMEVD